MMTPVRFLTFTTPQSAREQIEAVILEALDAFVESSPEGTGYTYYNTTGELTVTAQNAEGVFEDVTLILPTEWGLRA
jgi:hypothetical protein